MTVHNLKDCELTAEQVEGFGHGEDGWWLRIVEQGEHKARFMGTYTEKAGDTITVTCRLVGGEVYPIYIEGCDDEVAEAFADFAGGEVGGARIRDVTGTSSGSESPLASSTSRHLRG